MDKLQILIVDCGHEIGPTLQGILKEANFEPLSVNGECAGFRYVREAQPDMLFLGIHFSARNSWDLIRILRKDDELTALPIILVSPRASEAEHLLALELGADEYLSPPLNPNEVIARVRALLRRAAKREAQSLEEVLVVGDLQLNRGRHEVVKKGEPVDLTPFEFNTLQALMSHPGYVFSRLGLLEKVTGNSSQTIERTLDSHVKNLRRKLGDDPKNPQYIETVYGVGYRMPDPL